MKVRNKKKFIVRIIEIVIVLTTIIITPIAIVYANKIRGYITYGGEWLIPILDLMLILIIETIYEEGEK